MIRGYHAQSCAEYVIEFDATPGKAVCAFAAAASVGASARLCKRTSSGPGWELRIVSIRGGVWFCEDDEMDERQRDAVESVMSAVRGAVT